MNKLELAKSLSEKRGITVNEATSILDEVTSIIRMGVIAEGVVSINGFGKFTTIQTKPKRCIHPTTKEEMIIPEKTKVIFRPTDSFLD